MFWTHVFSPLLTSHSHPPSLAHRSHAPLHFLAHLSVSLLPLAQKHPPSLPLAPPSIKPDFFPLARYLPVEFARDVEQPSPTTATTQESVGLYLKQDPRDLCVVNAGTHDMQCTGGASVAQRWRNGTVIDDDKT